MNVSTRTLKGVSEVVGTVLTFAIVVGLISNAFLFGMPLLRKEMDKARVVYHEKAMSELADAIEATAREGGETRVKIEAKSGTPPTIKLVYDNTWGGYQIELRSSSKYTYYAPYDVPRNDDFGPFNESGRTAGKLSLAAGTLGVNKGVVLTARSTKLSGGVRLVMKLIPRPLRDPAKGKLTLIRLSPISGKSTRDTLPTTVVIKKLGETTEQSMEGGVPVTYRIITVGVGFE